MCLRRLLPKSSSAHKKNECKNDQVVLMTFPWIIFLRSYHFFGYIFMLKIIRFVHSGLRWANIMFLTQRKFQITSNSLDLVNFRALTSNT